MQGARILLVDDDRETRWALAAMLRREGVVVTEAGDGEDALRLLMRARYDLCVTDVCMPGLGGFGLFAALRFGDGTELAWARTLPILLLSGKAPPAEMAKALDSGVDDFLAKPCDPEEFKARVRAALRRARRAGATPARTHGDLADFGMAALAQAIHLGARTARLCVQSGAAAAVLDFRGGHLVHAQFEDPGSEFRGDEAAIRALALEHGVFEIVPLPGATPRTVFGDTDALLLRAAARRDESGEVVAAHAPAAGRSAV